MKTSFWAHTHIPDFYKEKSCLDFVIAYQKKLDVKIIGWLLWKEDINLRLTSTIFHIVKNSFDAEDIAQNLFLSLKEKLKIVRPIENCSAWLRTIVKNQSIDFLRSSKLRKEKELKGRWNGLVEDNHAVISHKIDAEKIVLEMRDEIAGIESGWEAILLKCSGKSYTECAKEMGITFKQFQGRYQRAHKKLSDRYGKNYEQHLIFESKLYENDES